MHELHSTSLLRTLPLLLLVMAAGHVLTRLPAQQPAQAPARQEGAGDIFSFTLVVTGKGSDPRPPSSRQEQQRQNWTYRREVTGWFEVDTTSRNVGRGAGATEQIEFQVRRKARHQIHGGLHDWAFNSYRELGEASLLGLHVDYVAIVNRVNSVDFAAPEAFQVTLDSKQKAWQIGVFMPEAWIGQLEQDAGLVASATWTPTERSGYGQRWTYSTNDRNKLTSPEGHAIAVRYCAGLESVFPRADLSGKRLPAKFDGEVATGSFQREIPKPAHVTGSWDMQLELHWSVRATVPELELEVRSPGYDAWRPTATLGSTYAARKAGTGLPFLAELKWADRKTKAPLPEIASITWQLVDTSSEPGIAMNYPYRSADKRPDLTLSETGEPSQEDQQELVLQPEGALSRVTVLSFDWGAWSLLRVQATLKNGRVIEGVLRGAPATGPVRDIPVPAREPGSKIARVWQQRYCPDWAGDNKDDDATPAGMPGIHGDGFTVYEEYRGFYWGGRPHLSTSPANKDLFVFNKNASNARAGIRKFAAMSQLRVHRSEQPDDLSSPFARTINVNLGAGPTNGPQGGVWLESATYQTRRLNDLIPENSRPGRSPAIRVPTTFEQKWQAVLGGRQDEFLTHMVVQALFQVCGVSRPGPSDTPKLALFVPADTARQVPPHFLVGGHAILETSDGTDLAEIYQGWHDLSAKAAATAGSAPPAPGTLYLLVGAKGGSHSGPEDCVMRDWFADAYLSRTQRDGKPVYRYLDAQKPGGRLGNTRKGTGINAEGHAPEPFFGDSDAGVPANKQLVVRDSAR